LNSSCYRARFVFPVSSPPLEDGVVEVTGGVISAIHNRLEPRALDLGNAAILPGLVNAHTHLEFSSLAAPLEPAEPFSSWIRALVSHRRSRTEDVRTNIAQGLAEAVSTGSWAIGEIATEGWSPQVFMNVQQDGGQDFRVVVFRELLALAPERIEAQLAMAREHLAAAAFAETDIITHGLSPHAPYSVHPDLFHQLVALCKEHHAPLAMHLAETPAELELLKYGTGELVEMLSAFGVWRDGLIPKNSRILDYLEPLAGLDRGLIVHGNYLSDVDIAFLAKHPQLSVVYCPRTHAYFGHANHPWPKLVEAGVRVGLGTDSRASNPDLSLWAEVKFLRRKHPDVPPSQWLQWATRDGAVALYGQDTKLGGLAIGDAACFSVVPLVNPGTHDPYAALLG
jgi:cytosine/adenosine deaminase-related metal-dependent hydrolase